MLINKLRKFCSAVKLPPVRINSNNFSCTSYVRHKAAYEGDGKTMVRVINMEQDLGLMIDSYSTFGFRLNNGLTVLGPMAIFPRTVLSWQVHNADDITPESLTFFRLLMPKIDLVILGLDSNDRKVLNSAFRASREAKLNVEILQTEHACSTFNFLNAEGRSVGAVMIPPKHIEMNEDDMLVSKQHYGRLYNRSDDF